MVWSVNFDWNERRSAWRSDSELSNSAYEIDTTILVFVVGSLTMFFKFKCSIFPEHISSKWTGSCFTNLLQFDA